MDHRAINRGNWDSRADIHLGARGHAPDKVADPRGSPNAVAFDCPRLGELRGFDGVHLRCHLGADTICLARFGARKTGLDLVTLLQ